MALVVKPATHRRGDQDQDLQRDALHRRAPADAAAIISLCP
jgi:hypothetical protein